MPGGLAKWDYLKDNCKIVAKRQKKETIGDSKSLENFPNYTNIKNHWFKLITFVYAIHLEAVEFLMSHCQGRPSQLATTEAGFGSSQQYLSTYDD